jgi:hypothetical protein
VSDYGLDDRATGVRSLAGVKRIFPLASVSRPALGPTQPPVQWVPGVLSPGLKRGQGVTLTTHPHLVPRSWMSRSYIPLPASASMACRGTALLIYIYIYTHTHIYINIYIYIPRTNIIQLSDHTVSLCSSGSIVSDYGPGRGKGFFLYPLCPSGSTQPPVQWVPGVLFPGVKRGRGVMLTTHPHLVPRSWMSRSCISSPPKRLHGV